MANVACKACGVGIMQLRKTHRMSGIAVRAGYLLLVASTVSIVLSWVLLGASGKAASEAVAGKVNRGVTAMRRAGIAEPMIQSVVRSQQLGAADKAGLSAEQLIEVQLVQSAIAAGIAEAGVGLEIGGGRALFVCASSLLGGLSGVLLVLKKKILRCDTCGAVATTSRIIVQ